MNRLRWNKTKSKKWWTGSTVIVFVNKTSNKRISMKVYFSFSNYVNLYAEKNQDHAARVADQMQLHWSKNWIVANVERKEAVNKKIIGIVFFLHAHEWNYNQLKSINLFFWHSNIWYDGHQSIWTFFLSPLSIILPVCDSKEINFIDYSTN